MALWLLIHEHKHGVDVFAVDADSEQALPDPADVIEAGGSCFEPEIGEGTEWRGPISGWRREEA